MRTSRVFPIIFLFLILTTVFLPALEKPEAYFDKGQDGTLVLHFTPGKISGNLVRQSIDRGHKSEIQTSFRIQAQTGGFLSPAGEHREITIRITGYKDKITDEYILMQNQVLTGVFLDWEDFYSRFVSSISYPAGIPFQSDISVRFKERIIYKKLVPPFNIMYLLPGKFMRQSSWISVKLGRTP